ncbi:hypothetical protein [Azospirillum cavernae]|uniref:hypothetical protein n=1 Tax=Azospirillum cavernae TaxID=2320860 RepID=UPI001EE5A42A|nr:hypothetical protein [Azospirillum cavernae]
MDPHASPIPVALSADGGGAPHILVKADGKRDGLISSGEPRSPEEETRLMTDARLTLNGVEVFSFSLRAVSVLLRETLEHAGTTIDSLDWVVLR